MITNTAPRPEIAPRRLDLPIKRAVAREWLIFLALLPLGGFVCFIYYFSHPSVYAPFDNFWNEGFGFHRIRIHYSRGQHEAHEWFPAFLWFTSYLGLMFVRSIIWSVRAIGFDRRQFLIALVIVIGAIVMVIFSIAILSSPK